MFQTLLIVSIFLRGLKKTYIFCISLWSLMQNPSTAITAANMYYLRVLRQEIVDFTWLLKHKEIYLMTVLLPKR